MNLTYCNKNKSIGTILSVKIIFTVVSAYKAKQKYSYSPNAENMA